VKIKKYNNGVNTDHQKRRLVVPVAIAPFWHNQSPLLLSGYARR